MSSLNEVRASQKLLEDRVTDVTERLAVVENKVFTLERLTDDDDTRRTVAEIVNCENSVVLSRLDDLEDRARRDNLLFYGFDDSHSHTWASAEEKVRKLLSTTFSEQVPADGIARAHRLGSFVENKCRPMIVKFASSKLYVGKQCYAYRSVTDSVCEIGTYSAPLSTGDRANSLLPHQTTT
ncbi:hypothetical protein HPB51_000783 [Rhipicephalus microplus]|uniref:Uncharacterized protein n=1 Tax=Rhipicephalus microplus TaxID=6941 RepID=A0A9J6EQS0_RHIMP|nr:hypothetical protein HPB51_000783 [Rhipicephalus microplus]